MLSTIHLRILLFLVGCIGSRLLLVYLAKHISLKYLPYMGMIALIPATGFMYFYLSGTRTTGPEVFGGKIWWNELRPIHSLMYFMFALSAIHKNRWAWKYLLVDVIVGLVGSAQHYFNPATIF